MRTFIKCLPWFLCLSCLLVALKASAAGPPVGPIGPYPDLIAHYDVDIPETVLIPTPGGCTDPSTGLTFCWSDLATFEELRRYSIDIVVDTYLWWRPDDPTSLTLVDIWAKDLNPPWLSPLRQTGFDPINPEMVPAGPENFIGRSGTLYPAPLVATTLADLPSLLPGYDLSPFEGDPMSIVYVAQASVPASDFNAPATIPEPGTLTLLGIGTSGLLILKRSEKRKGSNRSKRGKAAFARLG